MSLLLLSALLPVLSTEICHPPDLSQPAPAADRVFKVIEDPNQVLRVQMENVMEEPGTLLPADIGDETPPESAAPGTRWLFSEATDWLLVPASMQVTAAAVGVDGSWVLSLAGPGRERLFAHSAGHCVGCAVSMGSGYFAPLAASAREMEFTVCERLEPPIERLAEDATRVRYRFTNASGLIHEGVARTDPEQDIGVVELVVTGLSEPVREAVLQAF